jgi:NADPH:quinone reductase-like Zn-dependent oxidoreductase
MSLAGDIKKIAAASSENDAFNIAIAACADSALRLEIENDNLKQRLEDLTPDDAGDAVPKPVATQAATGSSLDVVQDATEVKINEN